MKYFILAVVRSTTKVQLHSICKKYFFLVIFSVGLNFVALIGDIKERKNGAVLYVLSEVHRTRVGEMLAVTKKR